MSLPARPRQSGLNVFWALLAAIERTTQLEAQALDSRDFRSLDVLHEAKRADFARLLALGQRIGIDRSNAVLAERLRALEIAERRNEETARQGPSKSAPKWRGFLLARDVCGLLNMRMQMRRITDRPSQKDNAPPPR